MQLVLRIKIYVYLVLILINIYNNNNVYVKMDIFKLAYNVNNVNLNVRNILEIQHIV